MFPFDVAGAGRGMAVLGGALLHVLWQGSLVGLATAIALRLAGPAASRLRYRLVLGALALIAVAPLATVARRAGMLADWGVVTPRTAARASASSVPAPTSTPVTANEALTRPTSKPSPRDRGPGRDDALAWLGALWLAGAAFLLVRLAGGMVQVHRIRATARPAPVPLAGVAEHLDRLMGGAGGVPVLVSDRAGLPFASGVLRPAVVLPSALAADLSSEQVRVVLAHELAHVRRNDYAMNLGQRVLEAVLLFHPVVHWLSRVARDEREHCCDELAAGVIGDRRAVAGALLALEEARWARGSHALLPAAAGGPLLRRVERLLAIVPSRRHRWAIAAAAVLLTGGVTMVLATPATLLDSRVRPAATGNATPAGAPLDPTAAREDAVPVVWAGELRAGERLRVRNLVGSIRV